jgi:threonine synthase
LGEVMTPLLKSRFRGWDVSFKLEYVLPTGSYKDRGIAVCMNHLSGSGVHTVAEDSSGNAGASTAAYAAAAGMGADVYVPDGTSPAKVGQIRVYGAQCHRIPGTRTESSREAQRARDGVHYIGHSWNPWFACGIKSVAYEIAEQSDWCPPDWIVTPAGGGSLVLGLIDGFEDLLAAGYVQRLPKILAVQSAACAPIYQAWVRNDSEVNGVKPHQTYAEGVALPNPTRGTQVLQAMRRYNGTMLAVEDAELLSCWRDLAQTGIFVEPTSAVAVAGAWVAREDRGLIRPEERVVILITGHGLKTTPTLMNPT